jgi:ribosomal protein S20
MPDKFEQYYKYLKANGADVAPDFNSFKNTLSDSNKASKYYSYLKENQFDVPDTYDSFANTFGLKKKAGNLPSSGIPSRLPNEPNFLQQGQKMASGEIFKDISASVPKTTLKEAVIKDKNNNNSYLGAMWNNVVASAERLAGGAARLAQKFDTSPVSMIQESVDKAASSVTGINYEAQREKEIADKVKSFIGKARTSASSREYEQGLAEGFDITNGIGLDDLKGLGAVLPSMLADIAIAAPTAGSSFAIQGYDDALSTLDNIPEAKYMSETTRTAFGFGGAIVAGVLEKLGMDNILKSGTVTKYVTSKILKETAGELAKKGVKVTAEQFEKAVANKATQMLTKTALKNTVKAGAKSALVEGATEATQEGAMDLMKLAANQLEGSEIFDEEELKNTAASRYLNAAAMGGIFGGTVGSISSRTKNVQQHIEDEVKNAKTQEDIDNIVNEINQSVQEGVISENDAQVFKSMVDENISKPSSLEIENEKETKLADIDEYINSLDKRDRLYNDKLNELNKERSETISYYDNLSKKSQKDEETSFDDGKITPAEEIVTEEVTPTEVKIGDSVQWTSQGADQFVEPKKIKSISEDGKYAFVEGSDTGIPVTELSVAEIAPKEVKVTEKIEDVLPYVVEGREKFEPVIEKIKNNEIVNENDLYDAAKVLEDLKSKTNNESLNNLINPIIDKILTYENQSKTEVSTITQKGAVTRAGVDVRKKEVSKSIGQFEGSKATIKSPDGKTVNGYIKSEGGKYVLYNSDGNKVASIGEKQITDRDVTLPSTELVPNPITLDNNGNIKSITFQLRKVDKETGLVPDRLITIDFKDPEKALDYAIQLRAEQVGEFSDAEFEEIITQVEKEVPIKSGKEVKEEGKKAEEPKIEKEPSKEEKLAEAYKDLTRNEKRQIINSKFDELIKALKIEKICPT